MRVDFYTLELRGFGQRAKRGAQSLRERTKLTKINEKTCFFIGSDYDGGTKRKLCGMRSSRFSQQTTPCRQ